MALHVDEKRGEVTLTDVNDAPAIVAVNSDNAGDRPGHYTFCFEQVSDPSVNEKWIPGWDAKLTIETGDCKELGWELKTTLPADLRHLFNCLATGRHMPLKEVRYTSDFNPVWQRTTKRCYLTIVVEDMTPQSVVWDCIVDCMIHSWIE